MKIVIKSGNKIVNRFNNILQFHIKAEGYCEETYYHLVMQQKTPLEGVKRVVVNNIEPNSICVYNDNYLIV